jgi:hypothetical protein
VDLVRFLIKVANSNKNGCNMGSEHVHTHCVGLLLVYCHFEHRLLIISNVRGLLGTGTDPLAVIKVILKIDKLQFSNDKFNSNV